MQSYRNDTMIRDWRSHWGQGDFSFLIQQLANNSQPPRDANQRADWAFLREAQQQVADTVPNCGMAVAIEIVDAQTIHPLNKQDVGKRLALVALEKAYGRPVESSGPRFDSMTIEGGAIRIKFTHTNDSTSQDGDPHRFAIAGQDRKFALATAKVEGDTVVVSSPTVPNPVAVRYAWAENPEVANLYNAAGLSAEPFRTDDWE